MLLEVDFSLAYVQGHFIIFHFGFFIVMSNFMI
jgi:hypothetical protein